MPRPFSFKRDEAAAKAERTALEALLAHFRGILTERTIPVRDRYLRSRKVSEINASTAKVIIAERFREAGLEAKVTGQLYRARVEVTVTPSYRVRFYVNYKKMLKEGLLDELVTAVQNLANALDLLGYGAVVERYK